MTRNSRAFLLDEHCCSQQQLPWRLCGLRPQCRHRVSAVWLFIELQTNNRSTVLMSPGSLCVDAETEELDTECRRAQLA